MAKYKMTCTVTGLTFATNAVGREKLIKRYGSEEALETDYVSRIGRRLLKDGLTVDEIKAKVAAGEVTSSTKPTKVKGKAKAAAKAKAVAEPTLVVEDDPDIDPEIAAFLAPEEDQPAGDASDKAV